VAGKIASTEMELVCIVSVKTKKQAVDAAYKEIISTYRS
jgi:hypothetical protein